MIIEYKRIITKSIVGSQKFILDREMIKHAVKTSFCKPSDLKKLTTRAIPPFNSMWIEWDEQYTARKARRMGYFLQRLGKQHVRHRMSRKNQCVPGQCL